MKIYRFYVIFILSLTLVIACATRSPEPRSIQTLAARADGIQTYLMKSALHDVSINSQSSLKKVMYQQAQDFCRSLPGEQLTKAILDRLSTRQDNIEMVFICE